MEIYNRLNNLAALPQSWCVAHLVYELLTYILYLFLLHMSIDFRHFFINC